MNWKKLTRAALAAATLSGIAATASAQTQSCPDDARAQIIVLERQVEQRVLAARETPEDIRFIPNQDDMFNQAHDLFKACPDNQTVNAKLPFMFFSLSFLSDGISQRAAISDLAYTALMRAKARMQATIDDETQPGRLREIVRNERNELMENLTSFIIPAMFEHGALTGSGFAAFSNQETPDTCPYSDGERPFLFAELDAHGETIQNALYGLMQSGYVLTEPPLEYRLRALRRACPDHAKRITVDLAAHWGFIARAAHEAPDATLINGEPRPADLVETASTTARDLLENYELMREDPIYLDDTLNMAEQVYHQNDRYQRTRLANETRQMLDEIASARRNSRP